GRAPCACCSAGKALPCIASVPHRTDYCAGRPAPRAAQGPHRASGGWAPCAYWTLEKVAPRACHRTASAPRIAQCCAGRPAPSAWNRTTQGSRRASCSAARPVHLASGRATVLCSAICLSLCIIHTNFLIFIP
ncbi:hypothetical protein HAX54_018731, partial [Datura stramonium]|nr:hypothetical protein [Datura stramonium]